MIILHGRLTNGVTVLLAVHNPGADVQHATAPAYGAAAVRHVPGPHPIPSDHAVLCGRLPAHTHGVTQRHGCKRTEGVNYLPHQDKGTRDNTVTPPSWSLGRFIKASKHEYFVPGKQNYNTVL